MQRNASRRGRLHHAEQRGRAMISWAIALALAAQAHAAKAKPAAPVAAAASEWVLRKSDDTGAGAKSLSASVRTDDGARLVLRCDIVTEAVLSVQYLPPKAPGSSGDKYVTVMPDKGSATVAIWEFPGVGALNRDPATVFALTQAITSAPHVRVSTTDAAGEPISTLFASPPDASLFKQVYAACGTPYAPPAPKPTPSATPAPAAKPATK